MTSTTPNENWHPSPKNEPEITQELVKEHGLNTDEYEILLQSLGRPLSFTELGIFSVMWSEHCSYKSSKIHLKKLPTKAPWVIQGPGENAGVIDIGDHQAAIFKMESHNHPSFIEPYQGAATGVGGILRDIFTMGARPVASLNALRFGAPEHQRTPHLVSGVVAGIAGYGNCMGIPTVGGEVSFHPSYNNNILVNVMSVGLADQDKIFYAAGAKPDQPVIYVGAKTGRDGIHGATMASASFDEESEEKRPTVQVGDPFTEKLLMEACLELMQKDAIVSIQDMGAAGLTSSSVEIAAKGKIGISLDLDKVPQREDYMTPYEIMLSESQERMLMILKPGQEDTARKIFKKWDLDFAVIGTTTKKEQLVINMYNQTWCDIPVSPLVDKAPEYNRPYTKPPSPKDIPENITVPAEDSTHLIESLKTLVSSPDLTSKKWIWEQYDSLVGGQTYISPGITDTQNNRSADAAIVKIPQSDKALAITSDCTPRYCYANPYIGGMQAVCESYRNICASGAKPLAITNNLNFANPEKPEIMAQLVGCVEGMAKASRELDYPVVSGNVSLYNETRDEGIFPTPTIGGVGLIKNWQNVTRIGLYETGLTLISIGQNKAHLGQSLYLKYMHNIEAGPPPLCSPLDEKKHGDFILLADRQNLIRSCHDVSDGGLLIALTEMAIAGQTGIKITHESFDPAFWFGEDQGRYIIATFEPDTLLDELAVDNINAVVLGKSEGHSISFSSGQSVPLSELKELHESWFLNYFKS